MKKIVLFASAMLLCAGVAFAQNPVKKGENKSQTEQVQVTKPESQTTPQKHCGNCPHHKACANKGTEGNKAATKQDNNTAAQTKGCNKGANSTCNKTGKKETDNKAAATK